ncbi:hypothetical protein EDD11_002220 [Mortierella claussenii]|nr:hypothetical protein EDD11_002220 [Mortierella claussenii]
MASYDDDPDDDDDFAPSSTPHNIRVRHVASLPPPPSKSRSGQSAFHQPPSSSSSSSSSSSRNSSHPVKRMGLESMHGEQLLDQTPILSQDRAMDSVSSQHAAAKPRRRALPLSLKKPLFRETSSQKPLTAASVLQVQGISTETDSAAALTQETVSSSQGSDDDINVLEHQEYVMDRLVYSQSSTGGEVLAVDDSFPQETRGWSLSPHTTNPFSVDLVATSPIVSPALDMKSCQRREESPNLGSMDSVVTSMMRTDDSYADPLETQSPGYPFDFVQDADEILECVICGKSLVHLDRERIAYHINNCIDEQQTLQSLETNYTLSQSVSSSQGEFAGAQVDYLSRVKRCPICKLEWPLRGKTKSGGGSSAAPRKARQKVDHMKRCAQTHGQTTASLIYQIRLLKDTYKRSLSQATGVPSDQDGSKQKECYSDPKANTATQQEAQSAVRKTKTSVLAKRQVESLTDTADADFISDAIITTVHAPTPSRPTKVSRHQQSEADQQDEGLQMALAISMSLQSSDDNLTGASRSASSFGNSAEASVWSMVPQDRGSSRKASRRRRQTEREKNETTVLPYAEVQHLIQANVHALLFPDTDDVGNTRAAASTQLDSTVDLIDSAAEPIHLKTPPWRPSRFSEPMELPLETALSQTSEPDTSSLPTESLWELSQLQDTRNVEYLNLPAVGERNGAALEPEVAFDREKYVSRFMQRFMLQKTREEEARHIEAAHSSNASPNPGEPSIPTRSGPDRRSEDSKFTSPLWSASKCHKTSLRNFHKLNLEASSRVVQAEIIKHLEVMEQQIQQAKRDAYHKILSSLKERRTAVDLSDMGPPDILIIEDDEREEGVGSDDDVFQSPDTYPEPSSPLLRYSRPSELFYRSPSPPDHGPYSSQLSDTSAKQHGDDGGKEGHDGTYEDHIHDDLYYHNPDDTEELENRNRSCTLVYSPNANLLETPQDTTFANGTTSSIQPIELDMLLSPEASSNIPSQEDTSFSRRISSSSDLPPPLDFAKLGYYGAVSLSTPIPIECSVTETEPTAAVMNWSGITTPKRKRRTRDSGSTGEKMANEGEEEDVLKVPSRPRSAYKTRVGLPVLSSTTQSQVQRLKRSVLDGLPLLKTASSIAGSTSALISDNTVGSGDDDEDYREQVATGSQNERMDTQIDKGKAPHTPSRPRWGRPKNIVSSQSTVGSTPYATASVAVSPPPLDRAAAAASTAAGPRTPQTPSTRKKSRAVLRAEALAAESAKLVANIRSQRRMPEYSKMSVARLRLAATTFGLKAGNKKLLVEQLTTIWENLNPNPPSDDSGDMGQEQAEAVGGSSNIHVVDDNDDSEDDGTGGGDGDFSPRPSYAKRSVPSSNMPMEISSSQFSLQQLTGTTMNFNLAQDQDQDDDMELGLTRMPYTAAEGNGNSSREQRWLPTTFQSMDDDHSPIVSEEEQNGADTEQESEQGSEQEDVADEETLRSQAGLVDNQELSAPQQELAPPVPNLDRQLLEFLNRTAHFRRQLLTYKPLDLEQVWQECQASSVECTRVQLRQFLDQQGIVCIVPAHSTLGSWRKMRSKKRKRTGAK